jgi:hypothetical protein
MTTTELEGLVAQLMSTEHAVPHSVLDAAKGAWAWRTIDLDLAELTFDSQLADAGALRSTVLDSRLLRFSIGASELDVEVEWFGTRCELSGTVTPALSHIDLQTPTQDITIAVTDGRFDTTMELVGPVRFVLRSPQWRHATPWLVV